MHRRIARVKRRDSLKEARCEEEEIKDDDIEEDIRVIEVENKRQRVHDGYMQGDPLSALQRLREIIRDISQDFDDNEDDDDYGQQEADELEDDSDQDFDRNTRGTS